LNLDRVHVGPIRSAIGGRTDAHHILVPANAYVLPADVVSAMPGAEGNSEAGFRIIEEMFGAPKGYASGGAVNPQEIMAAGGEVVLSPDQVAAIGGGDIAHGHDILDHFVKQIRAENIKALKSMKGPVR
jgi:hypothetical protein